MRNGHLDEDEIIRPVLGDPQESAPCVYVHDTLPLSGHSRFVFLQAIQERK
jgi:hypothetical protein